jgi:signal peptidase II
MKKLFTKGRIALLVIFSVLIIDQIIKIWIKTHMYWHESIRVTGFISISPKTTVWLSVWKYLESCF